MSAAASETNRPNVGGEALNPALGGSQKYRDRIKGGNNAKNRMLMMLLQMMMADQQPEDKATQTYQEHLAGAGDKQKSSLTPALANNPATELMGPQEPNSQHKDDFKNMLLALLLKSQS